MQSTNLGYTYSLTYTHVCLFVFSSVVLSRVDLWIHHHNTDTEQQEDPSCCPC